MKSDLVYSNGVNELNFPLTEGKVWSEAAVGTYVTKHRDGRMLNSRY